MNTVTGETDCAADLAALREELAGRELDTATVERVYRRIARCAHLADLKVAWLGNHTLDPVLRHATAAAFSHGFMLGSQAGSFDQYFQAVLDPSSGMYAFAPDAIVLSLSLRGLAPDLVSGGAALPEAARQEEADRVLDHIDRWVGAARERTAASLMICNFPRPATAALGIADLRRESGAAALFSRLNGSLSSRYRDDPQVHVLDVDAAIASAGRRAAWNPQMYHLAKIEWSGPGLAAAAELIARALRALKEPAKKCLLLDLDNTLWGGIVGEDGVDALHIEQGDPVGEAFLAFQRAVLDVKARGVLLGLVSKNNSEDVEEAFDRLNMPLRFDDFAAKRINWEHKHVNIQGIAVELDIGLDSLVFVDDNPIECELVRQMVPEVEVLALPSDPAAYADALLGCWHFDKLVLTEEDTRKTEQYKENAARAERLRAATDLSGYLESLGTRLEIGRAGKEQLARLHQLFGKTNQFNLTTKRYTAAELQQFADSDEWLFEWVKVRDNFGDLGLVGAYLVKLDSDEPEIDSFVLSCRALGREVETGACNRIKDAVFRAGAKALIGRFRPTGRNRPCAGFYESQGFAPLASMPGGETTYRIPAAEAAPLPCGIRDVTIREETE